MLESPDPKTVKSIDGCHVVVTSNEHFDRTLVEQLHSDLIVPTFSAHEVEDIDMWLSRLDDQKKSASKAERDTHFVFAISLLVRDSDGKCLGAAVHEVYLDSRTALISYIVVSPELRGQGAAALLNASALNNAQDVIQAHFGLGVPLEGMFIEVLQVRDDHCSRDDAYETVPEQRRELQKRFPSAARQKVFQRLGYVALDLDLVHPGRMKGHRYNLGVMSFKHNPRITDEFPSAVVLAFLKGLFEGILGDEGSADSTDYESYAAALSQNPSIRMGSAYWR
jgi:hypothetical protein